MGGFANGAAWRNPARRAAPAAASDPRLAGADAHSRVASGRARARRVRHAHVGRCCSCAHDDRHRVASVTQARDRYARITRGVQEKSHGVMRSRTAKSACNALNEYEKGNVPPRLHTPEESRGAASHDRSAPAPRLGARSIPSGSSRVGASKFKCADASGERMKARAYSWRSSTSRIARSTYLTSIGDSRARGPSINRRLSMARN